MPDVIILNFAHPFTDAQLEQLRAVLSPHLEANEVVDVRRVLVQFDQDSPLEPQVLGWLDEAGLSPLEWQSLRVVLNPPGLSVLAVALIAEVHGRCGFFPPVLRLRPVPSALPPVFEVFEVLNLQALRDQARARRV